MAAGGRGSRRRRVTGCGGLPGFQTARAWGSVSNQGFACCSPPAACERPTPAATAACPAPRSRSYAAPLCWQHHPVSDQRAHPSRPCCRPALLKQRTARCALRTASGPAHALCALCALPLRECAHVPCAFIGPGSEGVGTAGGAPGSSQAAACWRRATAAPPTHFDHYPSQSGGALCFCLALRRPWG